MGETKKKAKESKLSAFFKGLSLEFKKISWPDKKSIVTETITVTVVSVILGLIIALVDTIVQYGVNFLTM